MKRPVGWRREPARHALAAKGIGTHSRGTPTLSGFPTTHERAHIIREIMDSWNCDRLNAEKIYRWLHENDPAVIKHGNHPGDEAIKKAIDALGIPRYDFKLIAGRGELTPQFATNWGARGDGYPPEVINKWQKALEKHVGETVYLSGGGGWGIEPMKLLGVYQEVWNKDTGRMGLHAKLERLAPSKYGQPKGEIFEPWLDSWQISVLEKVN